MQDHGRLRSGPGGGGVPPAGALDALPREVVEALAQAARSLRSVPHDARAELLAALRGAAILDLSAGAVTLDPKGRLPLFGLGGRAWTAAAGPPRVLVAQLGESSATAPDVLRRRAGPAGRGGASAFLIGTVAASAFATGRLRAHGARLRRWFFEGRRAATEPAARGVTRAQLEALLLAAGWTLLSARIASGADGPVWHAIARA